MQVSVETTGGLERRLTVALPADDIESAVDERLRSLGKTARLNGFRPGKVPFAVVKKRYEPQVRSEVLGSLINRSYQDALAQEKLRPAGQPRIEPVSDEAELASAADGDAQAGGRPDGGAGDGADGAVAEAGGAPAATDEAAPGFRYTATFEVYPEFEPKFDASIRVARPEVEVGEEDIDEMLENLRSQRTEFVAVERAAADGDQVVIDFTGKIDGEAFDGGSAEKAPLTLGSNSFIPGFEEQLVGVSAGDEKTVQVTFPKEYQAEHLAGKDAAFDVVVHEVREPKLPELDEELVRSFGIEDGSIESLRADIRGNMERELKQRVDGKVKGQVMDGLVAMNPIDLPSALVDEEIGRQREQLMKQMPEGADASFLGDDLFREQAERRVRLGLVVGEIIQRRELRAEASAVRSQVERLASAYQDPQQVVDHYYANPELLRNIEGLVLEDAVTETVLAAATVTDEPTSFKDVMNPPQPATDGAGDDEDGPEPGAADDTNRENA